MLHERFNHRIDIPRLGDVQQSIHFTCFICLIGIDLSLAE